VTKLDESERIGPSYAQSLKTDGIGTIEELLSVGRTGCRAGAHRASPRFASTTRTACCR